MAERRTWRTVDGVRVEGTWRHAFIHNRTYILTDLVVYADGLIDCWGLVTLDEFAEKLASGWVATEIPEGAAGCASGYADWKFAEPETWLTPELLLAEVADEIEKLNGRPGSGERCRAAAWGYVGERTEQKRMALREAYFAVPEHERMFLGDMDSKDWAYRVLITPDGARMEGGRSVVTAKTREQAFAYFTDDAAARERYETFETNDGPKLPLSATVSIGGRVAPNGTVAEVGKDALQWDYPAPITAYGRTYASVAQAYWALCAMDPEAHDRIAAAPDPYAARRLAAETPVRDGWDIARLAVMANLLRAKFAQHPELAELLLSTGDGMVDYFAGPAYWSSESANWLGRLLEVVRAELVAESVLPAVQGPQ